MDDISLLSAGALQRLPLPSNTTSPVPPDNPNNSSDVAVDFESVFMSLMLKSMRETSGQDGLFPGDSSDTFGGLFDLYMGRHLSQAQPLGIGDLIQSQVIDPATATNKNAATADSASAV